MQDSSAERRALSVSIVGSLVIAIGAIAWGLVTGSRVVLLDGVFVFLGMILTWMSLQVSKTVERGPTRRYPFGRDSLTPFYVAVQGLALLGTLVYAAVDAIQLILEGGSEVAPLALVVYGVATIIVAVVIERRIRSLAPDSDLARAEAAHWRAGLWLSVGMAAGAGVALLLVDTRFDWILPFVDPLLVLAACAVLIGVPISMVRGGLRELLESAPPAELQAEVDSAIAEVRQEFGLGEPIIRLNKVGRRLYAEVDFQVEPGKWDVADEDAVRRAVYGRLDHLGFDLWANVELTTDPELML